MTDIKYHESVLVKEVVENLHIEKNESYIDATLGTGGHTKAILESGGLVLAVDADPEMLKLAEKRLEGLSNLKLDSGNFEKIDEIALKNGFSKVSGILFDLGVSNLHLTGAGRGFSFSASDDELDMRLNPLAQGVKAKDLLNALDKTQLTNLFSVTMKYYLARELALKVVEQRKIKAFEKVSDLVEITSNLDTKPRLNPATLPMLALRIAVNMELENLRKALPKAFDLLKIGGRLLVITFHSGEEKVVEDFGNKILQVIRPGKEEILGNPRARSAKLWVIEK